MRLNLVNNISARADSENAQARLVNFYVDQSSGTQGEVSLMPFPHATANITIDDASGGCIGGIGAWTLHYDAAATPKTTLHKGTATYGAETDDVTITTSRASLVTNGSDTPTQILITGGSTAYVGNAQGMWPLDGVVNFSGTSLSGTSGAITYSVMFTGTFTNDGTYVATQASTSGAGSGMKVSVVISGGAVTSINKILAIGTGYVITDTINLTIPGAGQTVPCALSVSNLYTRQTNDLIDTSSAFRFNQAGKLAKIGMSIYNSTEDIYVGIIARKYEDVLTLALDLVPVGDNYTFANSYGEVFDSQTCTYLDGYYIRDKVGTGRFYISELNNTNVWNSLDYGTAAYSGDSLQCVIAKKNELWLIGSTTTEIWYNSGNIDFPFTPIKTSVIQNGTTKPYTVSLVGNELMWVSSLGFVVKSSGLSVSDRPAPITEPVTGDYASVLQYGGYLFYCLFTNREFTYVYNYSTELWSRWAYQLNGIWYDYPIGHIYGGYLYSRTTAHRFLDAQQGTDYFSNGLLTRELRSGHILDPEDHVKMAHNYVEMYSTQDASLIVAGILINVVIPNEFVDWGAVGIALNSDYLINETDGTATGTITAVSGNTFTLASLGTLVAGDKFTVRSGVTGLPLSTVTPAVTLSYTDNGGSTVTRETLIKGDRVVWNMLGSARDRIYIFSITELTATSVFTIYAGLKKMLS